MEEKQTITDAIVDAAMKAAANQVEEAERAYNSPIPEDKRPTPKYIVGQKVKVCGWGSSDIGTIAEIKWIFHNRLGEYVWGYRITNYKENGPGLTFIFVPEGYLRNLNKKE